MARQNKKLTAKSITAINEPGMHGDGENLWLVVTPSRSKNWAFRYTFKGKSHTMGLGPIALVNLAEARQKAQDARRLLLDGCRFDYFISAREEFEILVERIGIAGQEIISFKLSDIPPENKRYLMCSINVSDEIIARFNATLLKTR